MTGQEPHQEGIGVPGAGGHVDHGCVGMAFQQLLVHAGHTGNGFAGLLGEHEGVPGGDEGSWQGGRDDGVVDVGHDAETGVA